MASSFLVPVALLLHDVPSSIDISINAPFDEKKEFLPRGRAETDVDSDAELKINVKLQSFSGGLHARGEVEAPWYGICRRCSIEVLGVSKVTVSERFVDERAPGDEDAYLIENDFVDLAPMAHDAILLDLPLAPLCKEDCKGLCPYCGIDRNEATCECQGPVDPRWATLDNLRFIDLPSSESEEN